METGPSAPRVAVAGAYAGGRERARAGLTEVRRSWRVILQATVAASLAYAAGEAIGHETPFFAPIAAIATVAISLAQRLRRATELLLGNAIGILLADLLVIKIGTGAWQVGLVVAIALTTALLAGGGPILIMQASSSAILIATITPPTHDQPWNTGRFADALIGGGIGLAVSALLMPVDPARHARSATDPVLAALHDGYHRVGLALRAGDQAAAEDVLAYLRGTAPVLAGFHAGLDATRESVRLAPWYWGQRTLLAAYALAGVHLDNAIRNLRVLARQATMAIDRAEPVPAEIPDALAILAEAVEVLGPVLATEESPDAVRTLLLDAVGRAVGAAGADSSPASGPGPGSGPSGRGPAGLFNAPMIVAVRLSVSDLLQATGLSGTEAHALIRAAGDIPG